MDKIAQRAHDRQTTSVEKTSGNEVADQDFDLVTGDHRAGRQPQKSLLEQPEPRPSSTRAGRAGTTAGTKITPQNDSFLIDVGYLVHREAGQLEFGKSFVTEDLDLGSVSTNDADLVAVRNEHRPRFDGGEGPVT